MERQRDGKDERLQERVYSEQFQLVFNWSSRRRCYGKWQRAARKEVMGENFNNGFASCLPLPSLGVIAAVYIGGLETKCLGMYKELPV